MCYLMYFKTQGCKTQLRLVTRLKMFVGIVIGIVIGFMIWFPYGIMYAVEATEPTLLMKITSVVKGLLP